MFYDWMVVDYAAVCEKELTHTHTSFSLILTRREVPFDRSCEYGYHRDKVGTVAREASVDSCVSTPDGNS